MKIFIKIASVSLMLSTFISIPSAEAVPVFAKNHKIPCSTCHSAFPRLNEFGAKFRLNGYRMPGQKGKGLFENSNLFGFVGNLLLTDTETRNTPDIFEEEHHDEGVEEDDHDDGVVEDEHHDDEAEEEHHDDAMITKTKSLDFSSSSMLVYSAGTLSENVSYMAHGVITKDATSLELLSVSFMDVLSDGALNVRVGKMSVDLPFLSSSRRLTATDYLLQIDGQSGHGHGGAESAGAGATLTNTGIEANGVYNFSGGQYLEYVFGVGSDQVEDSGNNANATYGYLNYGTSGQNIGLIYRSNRMGESDEESLDTDGLGIAASINFGRYNITSAFFRYSKEAEHGETVDIDSLTFEVMANVSENWYLLGRYDRSDTRDSIAESSQYVAGAVYRISDKIKLQFEYADKDATNNLGGTQKSTGIYAQIVIGF